MPDKGFVHLHAHTGFSLRDGLIESLSLAKKAKEFAMPAMAMTDHNNIFGVPRFWHDANRHGLKPIIGCEVSVSSVTGAWEDKTQYHLLLLCENNQGYYNLCNLLTAVCSTGSLDHPLIIGELLEQHHQGLIALSACLDGEISFRLHHEQHDRAREAAGRLRSIFQDRFYLELIDNGLPEQKKVNRELVAISRQLGIPMVATNNCHYLEKRDALAHRAFLCIRDGKTLAEPAKDRYITDEFHFCSPEEMWSKFQEVPEALLNTLAIAERCCLEFTPKPPQLPSLPLSAGMTLEQAFLKAVHEGFQKRIPDFQHSDPKFGERPKEYQARLQFEIATIQEKGCMEYFLIVADYVNWARDRGIQVGPGRGSAPGSLVNYCLRITDINPLAYGLFFERLNFDLKLHLPDIDVDVCAKRHKHILRYLAQKFGPDHVASTVTINNFSSRAAVGLVGKVMRMRKRTLSKLLGITPYQMNFNHIEEDAPELAKLRAKDEEVKKLLDLAQAIDNLPRGAHVQGHAAAISSHSLTGTMPFCQIKGAHLPILQYDSGTLYDFGVVTFDLFGFSILSDLDRCLKLIKKNHGVALDLSRIPLDDPNTYSLLGSGKTKALFQLESPGLTRALIKGKPKAFLDLCVFIAMFRPGPTLGMFDVLINRMNGKEKVKYLLPQLEEILQETYGIWTYQEQLMMAAVRLGGYSPHEADSLRKDFGKRKQEQIEAHRKIFVSMAVVRGIEEEKALCLFEELESLGGYGINKSHIVAYTMLTYQTAFLKANFPAEFKKAFISGKDD
jgi:DNA polymerase-3 subunit alpha